MRHGCGLLAQAGHAVIWLGPWEFRLYGVDCFQCDGFNEQGSGWLRVRLWTALSWLWQGEIHLTAESGGA